MQNLNRLRNITHVFYLVNISRFFFSFCYRLFSGPANVTQARIFPIFSVILLPSVSEITNALHTFYVFKTSLQNAALDTYCSKIL